MFLGGYGSSMNNGDRRRDNAVGDDELSASVEVSESEHFKATPHLPRPEEGSSALLRIPDDGLPSMSVLARTTSHDSIRLDDEANNGQATKQTLDTNQKGNNNINNNSSSSDTKSLVSSVGKKKEGNNKNGEKEPESSEEDLYTALIRKDQEIAELRRSFVALESFVEEAMFERDGSGKKRSARFTIDPDGPNPSFKILQSSGGRSDDPETVAIKNLQLEARNKGYKGDPYQRFLSRDTFSIMLFSGPREVPFWWCMSIFFVQMLTFTLVATNIIDKARPQNPLDIPPNVEFPVRITQLIAIMISVATQEDIRTAVNMAYDGYTQQAFGVFEGSDINLWRMSLLFRFAEGAWGLIVTFFLVMTEEEVVELLLNFTAMEFVSQLDEVAFFLARQGYVGKKNQLQAETVLAHVYYIKKRPRRRLRIVFLLIILTSMLFGFFYVVSKQQQGIYLCSFVFVQFSDDFVPALGTFSGLYYREDTSKALNPQRANYVEEQSGQGIFAYCDQEEAWTFGWENRDDPCADWVAISENTQTFDLVEAGSLDWFVLSEKSSGLVPMQYFQMFCYDCEGSAKSANEACAGSGTCVDNRCQCDDDTFGAQCEFPMPCPKLAVDESFSSFLGTREWSDEYSAIVGDDGKLLTVYDRPVYINEIDIDSGIYDVILFTGRRWIVTYSFIMTGLKDTGLENLIDFLQDFHGHFSEYQSAFISSAVDVGRPSNAVTPIQKDWFRPNAKVLGPEIQSPNENFPLDVSLLCGQCSTSAPCFFNSTCTDSGTCECTTGAQGNRCQIAPVNNGQCDVFFNTPEFDFDGGDCCEATCVSSEEFICGKDETGFIDIGYPECSSREDVWVANGNIIRSEIGNFATTGRGVALSSNGAILAVSEPGYDSVRIFDKDGSNWIQRGRTLEGRDETNFGIQISMSGRGENAVRNALAANPFTLGVSGNDYTAFHRCSQTGCREFAFLGGGSSFTLSSNGQHVLHALEGEFSLVQAYQIQSNELVERGFPIDVDPFSRKLAHQNSGRDLAAGLGFLSGRYLCVSNNGNMAAVGSLIYDVFFDSQRDTISGSKLFVTVFLYSSDFDFWLETATFESNHQFSDSANGFPVQSVALSDNGRVLAIASRFDTESAEGVSGVQVYSFSEGEWTERSLITRDDGDGSVFAWGVDLSADGSRMVVAGSGEEASAIRTYQWNGDSYEQLFNDIPGGEETVATITPDGSAISVGLPLSAAGGEALVYGASSSCMSGTQSFRVSVTTDSSPEETRWDVLDDSGNIVMQGGPYRNDAAFTTFVHEVCVDLRDECLIFTLYDEVKADGIIPPGGYGIVIDGKVVAQGDINGPVERVKFGNCPASPCADGESSLQVLMRAVTRLSFVNWALEDIQGEVVFEGGNYKERTVLEEFCVPSSFDCMRFAVTGGGCEAVVPGEVILNYDIFIDGELDSENTILIRCDGRVDIGACPPIPFVEPLECEEGSQLLRVEYEHTLAPLVTPPWLVQQDCGSRILLEETRTRPTDFGKTLVQQTCVPDDLDCLEFVRISTGRPVTYFVQFGDLALLEFAEWGQDGFFVTPLGEFCPCFVTPPPMEFLPPP